MLNSTNVSAIVAIVFILVVMYGLLKQIRTNGIGHVVEETIFSGDLESFVLSKIADALENTGIFGTYDEFKINVELYIVDQIRNTTDHIGGIFDSIADKATDEEVVAIIDKVLEVSQAEDQIKAAYDKLASTRIEEIEESEAEEAKKNEILETENLEKYETPENESEPEMPITTEEE